MDSDLLAEYGVDREKGLARCMNDEAFYQLVLTMFLQDDSFYRTQDALLAKDYLELFRCAHELKGVCGNAELPRLYAAVCPLVELVRGGKEADHEQAVALFDAVREAYEKARAGVEKIVNP